MTSGRSGYHYEYETVAIMPLPPGWRTIIECNDGSLFEQQCPALLVQELRSVSRYWTNPDGTVREVTKDHEEPYLTRVVPAVYDECDGQMHGPDQIGEGIVGLLAPGEQIPDHMRERAKNITQRAGR